MSRKLKLKLTLFAIGIAAIFVLVLMNISVANPESGIFFSLRRLAEKVQLSISTDPRNKLIYQYKLLDNRLADLSFVSESKASTFVLSTSLRYSTTLGQITDLIIQNNMKDEVPIALKKFNEQLTVVDNLINKYPKDDSEFKFIVDDANYLKIYITKLSTL